MYNKANLGPSQLGSKLTCEDSLHRIQIFDSSFAAIPIITYVTIQYRINGTNTSSVLSEEVDRVIGVTIINIAFAM